MQSASFSQTILWKICALSPAFAVHPEIYSIWAVFLWPMMIYCRFFPSYHSPTHLLTHHWQINNNIDNYTPETSVCQDLFPFYAHIKRPPQAEVFLRRSFLWRAINSFYTKLHRGSPHSVYCLGYRGGLYLFDILYALVLFCFDSEVEEVKCVYLY